MPNKTVMFLVAALLASGALAGPCFAGSIFNFQYSLPAPEVSVEGFGTLIADDVTGGYVILDIVGTRFVNGVPQRITGLIGPGGYFGNSNLLYYPNTPLLDNNGLSFMVAGELGDFPVNLFSVGVDVYTEDGNGVGYGTFSVTPAPEPSTTGLLALGAVVLGAWTRSRRREPSWQHHG